MTIHKHYFSYEKNASLYPMMYLLSMEAKIRTSFNAFF